MNAKEPSALDKRPDFEIRLIDPNLIDPNPYQPKDRLAFSGEQIAAMESVRDGFVYTPIARPHPAQPDRFQMKDGWLRRAAWMGFHPGELTPLIVQACDDRAMFADLIKANVDRLDLNDLQKIELLERATKELGMTQLEAGKMIGLTTQGAVGNLLGMGKLPAPVKQMLADGKIAQRNARALRVLEKIAPQKVVAIAEQSVGADNPEEFIDTAIERLLTEKGCALEDAPFELDWPATPIPLAAPVGDLTELVACKKNMCPRFFVRDEGPQCGDRTRFELKRDRALPGHVAAAATKLGIGIAGNGEKTTVLFDGTGGMYAFTNQLPKLLKAQAPLLRLAAYPTAKLKSFTDGKWGRERYLGSPNVVLVTTDRAAVDAWLKADGAKRQEIREEQKTEERATETAAQRHKRVEKEKADELEWRAERAAANQNKFDVIWLVKNVAGIAAKQMVIGGGLLKFVEGLVDKDYHIGGAELKTYDEQLKDDANDSIGGVYDEFRKERIALHLIAPEATDYQGHYEDFAEVCQRIAEIVAGRAAADSRDMNDFDEDATSEYERLALKLPAGWDKPPVHRTAFNCWSERCGKFAPAEKLTQRDVNEFGWIDDFENADSHPETGGVFCCAEHQQAYAQAQGKAKPGNTQLTKVPAAKAVQVSARGKRAPKKKSKSK